MFFFNIIFLVTVTAGVLQSREDTVFAVREIFLLLFLIQLLLDLEYLRRTSVAQKVFSLNNDKKNKKKTLERLH